MARRIPLVLVLLALFAATPALGDVYDQKREVDKKLGAIRDKIAEARAKENALAAQIDRVTGEIRSLEAEVGDVSRQVDSLERDLALHQERLDRIAELYRLQTKRLNFLQAQWTAAKERLDQRLVEIYKQDEPTAIEVVLSSRSFTEMLDQLEYVNAIGSQDKRIATEVQGAKREVASARKKTAGTKASVERATSVVRIRTEQVRAVRDELLGSQHQLESKRSEKQSTLADVQATREEFLHEAEGLAQSSADLGAKIRAAQAAAAQSSATTSAPRAASSSGFVWPCSGPMTSPFGYRWGRMHEGIDIGCGYGAPVAAAASGTVVYAGWMGGYGNLVVIDHGGGIATAYGHNSSIAVGVGQAVGQGQQIASVGSTGHSTGPHCHFEVRSGGSPVDPLGYL
jgi:murein DD-endopeptidase MepM/ murein hydrolase activator NlpD